MLQQVNVKKQSDEDSFKAIKAAVQSGIDMVETYFEKVEVPGSDSESENDSDIPK